MHNVVATVSGAVGRAIRAIPESRQKQIERETTEFITRSGGRLTDSLEFEMMQHLLGGGRASGIGPSTAMKH
jgi:hypothetical protein